MEEDWWAKAACLGSDLSIWFTEDNAGKGRKSNKPALACCSECPVKQECLDDAMKTEGRRGDWSRVRYGVRGGLEPSARVRLHYGDQGPYA